MKTILVADDEFDTTGTLRAILEGEGYRVETCSNGREALEHMRAAPPDLVLLDVMMPVLGGVDALKAMRQVPALAAVPVVLMHAVPQTVAAGLPAQGFLRKPFSLDDLLGAVERHLGKAAAGG